MSYMKDVLSSGIFNSSTDKYKTLNICCLFRNLKNICFDTVLCKFLILKSMSLPKFKWCRLGLCVGGYHFSFSEINSGLQLWIKGSGYLVISLKKIGLRPATRGEVYFNMSRSNEPSFSRAIKNDICYQR